MNEKKLTQKEKLAEVLSDGRWHEGPELAQRVGWRFGGVVLQLRKGKLNGRCWDIPREHVKGPIHRYKHVGFLDSYVPATHRCEFGHPCVKCDPPIEET